MFGKAFGKRASEQPAATQQSPSSQAMFNAIAERRKADPDVGAKIGSQEIVHMLIDGMQRHDPRGVHSETLVAILASLAGFACVLSAVATVVETNSNVPKKIPVTLKDGRQIMMDIFPINTIKGADGRNYFAGDAINAPLLEAPVSIAGLVLGMAQKLGLPASEFPNPAEIAGYVASTIGGPQFGIPRLASGASPPSEPPLNLVRAYWPALLPKVKAYCPRPQEWPLLYGLATQQAMETVRSVLPPALSARLALECAVPMAKLDPATLTA
jgi:hypothetical protein